MLNAIGFTVKSKVGIFQHHRDFVIEIKQVYFFLKKLKANLPDFYLNYS